MSTSNSGAATTAFTILAGGVVIGGLAAFVYRAALSEEAPATRTYRTHTKRMRAEKQYRREMRKRIHAHLQRA